jgi:hypothetical protein
MKFINALSANFGSGGSVGMSEIHLLSVQHHVQSQTSESALA